MADEVPEQCQGPVGVELHDLSPWSAHRPRWASAVIRNSPCRPGATGVLLSGAGAAIEHQPGVRFSSRANVALRRLLRIRLHSGEQTTNTPAMRLRPSRPRRSTASSATQPHSAHRRGRQQVPGEVPESPVLCARPSSRRAHVAQGPAVWARAMTPLKSIQPFRNSIHAGRPHCPAARRRDREANDMRKRDQRGAS